MITVEIYIFLAAVVAAAFVYIFLDLDNRLYGNLFAAGFAGIMSGLLALWSFNENTVTITTVPQTAIAVQHYLNDTLANVTTTYAYQTHIVPIVDPALGYFWMLVMVFMWFLVGYFVLEIMHKSRMPDDEEAYE